MSPGINAAVLEFVSETREIELLSRKLSELHVKRPYTIIGNIRPFDSALARFDGHTADVWGVAVLEWPGLDHPVIVTTAPATGRPGCGIRAIPAASWPASTATPADVFGVAVLEWPGRDHPVIVTCSAQDGTARVWDPHDPGAGAGPLRRPHRDVWGWRCWSGRAGTTR